MTLRTRAAGKISALGATIHTALFDLSLTMDRRIATRAPTAFHPRPWLGVVILLLLAMGVGSTGWVAVEAIHYAVGRVSREDVQ